MKSVELLDRENVLLSECEVISALLSESSDADPGISQRAGMMLLSRIEEVQSIRGELNSLRLVG